MKTNKLHHKLILLAVLPVILLMYGCDQTTLPAEPDTTLLSEFATEPFDLMNAGTNRAVAAQLAEVRRVTAPYHNISTAENAGWTLPLSPCVEHPELGGMGYHYGNLAYLTNGALDPLMPEVLMYEPTKNGRLRLVGVEYIVDAEDEYEIEAPELFGQHFHWNEMQGFWALHVWLWKHNPEGMFEDWNPNVSCEYAPVEE